MIEHVEGILCINAKFRGHFVRCATCTGECFTHFGELIEEVSGGFFASFNAGLMVGVDVHQAGVEADGTLKQSDEHAQAEGIEFGDAEGDGLPAFFGQGLAGAA